MRRVLILGLSAVIFGGCAVPKILQPSWLIRDYENFTVSYRWVKAQSDSVSFYSERGLIFIHFPNEPTAATDSLIKEGGEGKWSDLLRWSGGPVYSFKATPQMKNFYLVRLDQELTQLRLKREGP